MPRWPVPDAEHENPTRPAPPPTPQRTSNRSLLPVVMVMVPLLILLVGIVAFTGKAGLLMVAVIASVPAFMILHYLLWGYWLGKVIREQNDDRERMKNEE